MRLTLFVSALALLCVLAACKHGPPIKGDHEVSYASVTISTLAAGWSKKADVYFPSDYVQNASSPLPVIAFGHSWGFGGLWTPIAYRTLYLDIASFGFVVVAPRSCPLFFCPDFHLDVFASIEALQNKTTEPQLEISDYVDRNRSGAIG